MATAAELKARLLKHANKQTEQSAAAAQQSGLASNANAKPEGTTGSPGSLPGVEGVPHGVGSGNELLVRETASLVAEQREGVLDGSINSNAVCGSNAANTESSVPDVSVSADVQHASIETDLQPTTLVVVERPVSSPSEDTEARDELQPGTNLDITNPVHQEFLQRLSDVETALLNRDPLMKTHLGAIHKAMLQYEEIANLLRPEEIAKIMAAQQAHTGIVLRVETVSKSKAAASKKAATLGLNDV